MAKVKKHGSRSNDMLAMILSIQKNFSDCVSGVQEVELEDVGVINIPPKGKKGDGVIHPIPPKRKRRKP